MPLAGNRLRADDFREKGLGRRIAVQDAVLTTLFVVHDKLQCDACITRPRWQRRFSGIAAQVSRVR
jgi:hypothetical protein